MQIRTEENKLLFEWEPVDNTVTIVRKGKKYRVRLYNEQNGTRYKVIDTSPKDLKLGKSNIYN